MLQQNDDPAERIETCAREKGRYKAQAYFFVLGGLDHTLNLLNRKEQEGAKRHVTGQELSRGIKDYAIVQFGPSARLVLEYWNIHSTSDFGRIVYDLIELGYLGRNDSDRLEDFDDVFDLNRELVDNYPYRFSRS